MNIFTTRASALCSKNSRMNQPESRPSESAPTNAAWVALWKQAGPKLEQIRRDELRRFRHEDHWRAIDSLMDMGRNVGPPRLTSGLVEQQRLFHSKNPAP
jgi:hypothetical protein